MASPCSSILQLTHVECFDRSVEALEDEFANCFHLRQRFDLGVHFCIDQNLAIERLIAEAGGEICDRSGHGILETSLVADAPECRIGIPNHWLITLAAAGALNDFMVFGIYLWLLRPLTGKRFIVQENVDSPDTLNVASPQYITLKSQTGALRSQDSTPLPEQITSETPAIFRLKALIKKSIFGLCMMIPMETFNFVYFIVARGMEMGWVCFTICTVDGKLNRRVLCRMESS